MLLQHIEVIGLKIAYCILVHKNPRQINRLLRSIHSEEDFYYVNVFHGKHDSEAWQNAIVEVDPGIHVDYDYGMSWGMFPLVQATLGAMHHFSSIDYDYFINLTGQCYPLKSIATIKRILQNQKTAFMEAHRLPYANWGSKGGLERIASSYYKHPIFAFRDWALNRITDGKHFETRHLLRVPKTKTRLPGDYQPYGGSAYFCATKKHVDYILKYLRENPEFLSFYRHSFAPDEMVFQTILLNSELKETVITDNNFRYIDWSKPGEVRFSPAVLTTDDAESILQSSALFARKFDMSKNSEILDLIDKYRD